MRVKAVCAAPKPLEEIADRHGRPSPPRNLGCESRRRLVRIVPPVYGLWHCFTHTNCICNDTIACTNRVIGRVPLPTADGVVQLGRMVRRLWPLRHFTPLSLEESLATFKGTKNKVYLKAYLSLLVEPVSIKDSRIKAFVKAERFDPADKENPDPRMIQARDPRYNLCLAKYLRPIEHAVYGLQRHGMPVIVKCMNPRQRAELVMKRWAQFDDPVCFSLDCSRWDKHVSAEVLQVEHDFYRSCFPGEFELSKLLEWQMDNICTTSNRLRYRVRGGRMSGDMNTAVGNCVLMVAMVFVAMAILNVKRFEVVDDGDDCLVLVERSELMRLTTALPQVFLSFGQELKIENIASSVQDIVFCQGKIVLGADGWTFARNWRKVLSQSCCGTKHWNDPNMVRPMFGLIGDCENAVHRGIPILQAFATRLRELSCGYRCRLQHLDSSYQYRISNYQLGDINSLVAGEVTWEARAVFEKAFGVDPSTQIAIENALRAWTPTEHLRDVGEEFVGGWPQQLDPSITNPTVL